MSEKTYRKDPIVSVKSFTIAPAGGKLLDGVTTDLVVTGGAKLVLPKFKSTFRFDKEATDVLIAGLQEAQKDSPKKGTSLVFHVGQRETNEGGRIFNASFAFIKPLQLAPNERPADGSMAQAVGGGVTQFTPVTKAAAFKANGTE